MPYLNLANLGSTGISKDIPANALALQIWSDGRNVAFDNNSVQHVKGYQNLLRSVPGDQVYVKAPLTYGLWPLRQDRFIHFALFGLEDGKDSARIVSTNGRSVIASPDSWKTRTPIFKDGVTISGGVFDGTGVFCFGKEDTVYYLPQHVFHEELEELYYGENEEEEKILLSERLAFNVVRPMWQHLFGLGVTVKEETASVPAGYYPRLLWFSNSAAPGQIPGDWEADNPESMARYYPDPFAGYSGDLVDMVQLGQYAVVYQEGACHLVTYTGKPPFFIGIKTAFSEIGAIATNCVAAVRGQHVTFTDQDMVIHNTQDAQSLLDKTLRKWVLSNLDATHFKNSFVTTNIQANEVWLCFPEEGEVYPNLAVVWNYEENTRSIRELKTNTTFAVDGKQTCFSGVGFTSAIHTLFMSSKEENEGLLRMNTGNLFDEDKPECYVEKTDFVLNPQGTGKNLLTRIWPTIDSAKPVDIYLGHRDELSSDIEWTDALHFDPQTQENMSVVGYGVSGRYHSIRVKWCHGRDVDLLRIGMEYQPVGVL
jgi:hypothetical protein